MSINDILSSNHLKRIFLLTTSILIVASWLIVFLIFQLLPDSRGWNLVIDFIVSISAGAMFALASAIFLKYFFGGEFNSETTSKIIPQDISDTLNEIANNASRYIIFVRTGRHFRAKILPCLLESARKNRSQISVDLILLDIRDGAICENYSRYRTASSFDKNLWSLNYVRKEILATIISSVLHAENSGNLLDVNIYLSNRLSMFRMDGNQEKILVTREDPRDVASCYSKENSEYHAFLNEFSWIRDASFHLNKKIGTLSRKNLAAIFAELSIEEASVAEAIEAIKGSSPYAR